MTAYNDEDENLMADRRPNLDQQALEAALQFNRIVDQVGARCMAVDGPVTPTLQEISEQELSDLWYAVQTIRAALPPSSAVVPEGWKLVPVDPTEAMTKAGFGPFLAAHDPFFTANEPIAPIYRAMLAASPSPPALDGAGRDVVIEECAKAGGDTLLPSHPILAQQVRNAIRSLKETP